MAIAKKINLGTFALWTYILSVVLLPIGFGGNRDIPFGLAQLGIASSVIMLLFEKQILQNCFWPKRIIWALAMFGIVILWGFLQTQSIMPLGWHHPLWSQAEQLLHAPLSGSIALWQEEAFYSLNRLVTYIAAGTLAYIFAQDAAHAQRMVHALWISGLVICGYAYITTMLGSETVLWQAKTEYVGDMTATFINHNHFAIYAGVVMVCGAALFYQSLRGALKEVGNSVFLRVIGNWLSQKGLITFILILWVLGAIILSHSRAGLMLSLAGLALFFIAYHIYAKRWVSVAILSVVSIIVCIGVVFYSVEASKHFANLFIDQSSADRLSTYEVCLRAIADNPLLGYGLGSFHAVFRLHNDTLAASFNRAHSDILESLVDLGLPAGFILWAAIVLLLSGIVRGIFKRRRNGMYPALGFAVAVIVMGHAAVDFSMQIPGVVLPLAMLMGAALAQSWGQSEKKNT